MTSKIYPLLGVEYPFDPTHRYFTSWLLPPWFLFFTRALITVYSFTTIFIVFGLRPTQIGVTFSYFTYLTFWGVAFYFLFSSFHTFCYARGGSVPLSRWWRWLQAAHSIYYTSICMLPWLVTIVYWGILFQGNFPLIYDAWDNISVHGLNSLFALHEIILPRTHSPPWLHLVPMILILAGYLCVAYITYATQHFYTYAFLNPSIKGSGIVTAYCFGILVAVVIIFCIVKGLIAVRNWLTEKKMGMMGKFNDGIREKKWGRA